MTKSDTITHVGNFLSSYTAWLWGCGATCTRIEKNVTRIAKAYDCEADLTIMPRHVTIAVTEAGASEPRLFNSRIKTCGINFDINTSLSALSWKIADRRLPIADADKAFHRITSRPYNNAIAILLLTSLANASFCRLFGGDAIAMAIVFVATAAGFFLKQRLQKAHLDPRAIFFLCAMVSTILCVGAVNRFHTATPGIAIATGVLYLIPGVPYINAASDLIARHYLCSFSRFVDALVLTAALSAGMCIALVAMHTDLAVLTNSQTTSAAANTQFFDDALFAAMAAIGFSSISHTPQRTYIICAVAAAAGHSLRYLLTLPGLFDINIIIAGGIAAFVIGCIAVLMAPVIKVAAEACLFPSLLPMIPGMYAYRTIAGLLGCLASASETAASHNLYILFFNGLMTMAIVITMVIGANLPIFMLKKISFQATR